MTFVRLFACGLLAHELLALCKDGRDYLSCTLAPTLGLRLRPWAATSAHGCLIATCVGLAVQPTAWPLYFLLLAALTTVIASYPVRLSNHLMLAWFHAALLSADVLLQTPAQRGLAPTAAFPLGVAGILVITYGASCFHKLNREYLAPPTSAAFRLAALYWNDRGVRAGHRIQLTGWLGIHGALVAEAALPVLLLVPATRHAALVAAVLFHFALSFFGVIHFSLCMYAWLAALLPQRDIDLALAALAAHPAAATALAAVVIGIVVRYAPTSPYRASRAVRAVQLAFAVLSALVLGAALAHAHAPPTPLIPDALAAPAIAVLAAIWLAMLACCAAPYLGWKTEFSLAMFSNLRPAPWCHVIVRRAPAAFTRAAYVIVDDLAGLPAIAPIDATTRRAIALLTSWRRLRYSPYLFRELLERVSAHPAPPVIRYHLDGGPPRGRDGLDGALAANLLPATLPRDPAEPYVK